MLAIFQFSSYCVLICNALLLADEFGEFASFATFAACKQGSLLLFYIYIALLLADEFGELTTFSRLMKFAMLATCNEGPLAFL